MKWFKFYGQDYLSDPKMLSLSATERSCWITLLAYASVNDNGMITFLSEQQLMVQAGIDFTDDSWDKTVGVLEKLEKLKMIQNDNGMITVVNWSKRQDTSLTSYERVKRYREKKQKDNAKITLEENRREENRRDKPSKESETDVSQVSLNELIELFKEINPMYTDFFKNKTERKALLDVVDKLGFEKTKTLLEHLPEIVSKKFAPKITKPTELKRDMGKLILFFKQENQLSTKGRGLEI